MKEIYAVDARKEACGRYGTFIKLTDYEAFSGTGWECWMTEGICIDQSAGIGICHCDSVQPFILDKMKKSDGQKLIICGTQRMILTVAGREDSLSPGIDSIEAFILNPGEIILLQPGVWYDICRGVTGPVDYFELLSGRNEICSQIEGGSLSIVLKNE